MATLEKRAIHKKQLRGEVPVAVPPKSSAVGLHVSSRARLPQTPRQRFREALQTLDKSRFVSHFETQVAAGMPRTRNTAITCAVAFLYNELFKYTCERYVGAGDSYSDLCFPVFEEAIRCLVAAATM